MSAQARLGTVAIAAVVCIGAVSAGEDAPESTIVRFPSRAALLSQYAPTQARMIETLGFDSPGDGGRAAYVRMGGKPPRTDPTMLQTPDGVWWRMTAPVISAKSFGAKGDGVSDDTAPITDFFAGVAAAGARGVIPKGVYAVDPITVSVGGWVVEGAGTTLTTLRPRAPDQSHVLFLTETANNVALADLGILGGVREQPGGRALVGLQADTTGSAIRNIRIESADTCMWMRQGGHNHVEKIYLASCGKNYLHTGATPKCESGKRFGSSAFSNVTVDARFLTSTLPKFGSPEFALALNGLSGVAFNIDSCSIYLKFDHMTSAGTKIGWWIHNDLGSAFNPDGIFMNDINSDWGAFEQFLVERANMIDVDHAWLRSLGGPAARLENFQNAHLHHFNAYASHSGVEIGGSFFELTMDDPAIGGNGWPKNEHAVNLHLTSGAGRVQINGGEIANTSSLNSDRPILSVGTTTDYNIVAERDFTGSFELIGTDLRGARVASTKGLIGRGNTMLTPGGGVVLENRGVARVTTNASGIGAIAHGLYNGPEGVVPNVHFVQVSAEGLIARTIKADATRLFVQINKASGEPFAGPVSIMWSAAR